MFTQPPLPEPHPSPLPKFLGREEQDEHEESDIEEDKSVKEDSMEEFKERVKEPKGWADQVEEEEEELDERGVQEESKDSPGKEGDTEEEVYRSYVKKTFKKDSLTLQRRLAVKFPQVPARLP